MLLNNKSKLNKKVIMIFIMLAFVAVSAFAQENGSDPFGMNSKVAILVNFITSGWVKGIACIALIVECIALITAGRQEPGMFKKFIPWIAGTIIFMAAGTITKKFMNVEQGMFDNVMSFISNISNIRIG